MSGGSPTGKMRVSGSDGGGWEGSGAGVVSVAGVLSGFEPVSAAGALSATSGFAGLTSKGSRVRVFWRSASSLARCSVACNCCSRGSFGWAARPCVATASAPTKSSSVCSLRDCDRHHEMASSRLRSAMRVARLCARACFGSSSKTSRMTVSAASHSESTNRLALSRSELSSTVRTTVLRGSS